MMLRSSVSHQIFQPPYWMGFIYRADPGWPGPGHMWSPGLVLTAGPHTPTGGHQTWQTRINFWPRWSLKHWSHLQPCLSENYKLDFIFYRGEENRKMKNFLTNRKCISISHPHSLPNSLPPLLSILSMSFSVFWYLKLKCPQYANIAGNRWRWCFHLWR